MARNRKVEFVVEVVDRVSTRLNTIGQKFANFTKSVAVAVGKLTVVFAAATAAVFSLANRISRDLDVYDKLSTRLNISVEALSQFEFIADRSGLSFRNLTLALQRMTRRVAEAAMGTGEAIKALQALNLSASDLNKLSPDQQFKAIAAAISEVQNPAERLALAFKLFDSEGVAVLQTLEDGVEGLEAMAREADALGATMSKKAVEAAKNFRDSIANLQGAFRGASGELAENLLPILTDFINFVAVRAPEALRFLSVSISILRKQLVDFVATLASALGKANRFLGEALKGPTTAGAALPFLNAADSLEKLTIELRDQADQYDILIEQALTYERTLKNVTTGLTGETPSVGGFDEPIEEITVKIKKLKEVTVETFDFMKEAAKQAARNMQQSLSQYFLDKFEGGLKGLLKLFLEVIRRMIAEAAAFQILNFSGIGGFFEKLLGRASGGVLAAGQSAIVGERGPELITAGKSGARVTPNSALGVGALGGAQFVTHIDARGADPGLIARLPTILEQRDKRLMLAVTRYLDTGVMPI